MCLTHPLIPSQEGKDFIKTGGKKRFGEKELSLWCEGRYVKENVSVLLMLTDRSVPPLERGQGVC